MGGSSLRQLSRSCHRAPCSIISSSQPKLERIHRKSCHTGVLGACPTSTDSTTPPQAKTSLGPFLQGGGSSLRQLSRSSHRAPCSSISSSQPKLERIHRKSGHVWVLGACPTGKSALSGNHTPSHGSPTPSTRKTFDDPKLRGRLGVHHSLGSARRPRGGSSVETPRALASGPPSVRLA